MTLHALPFRDMTVPFNHVKMALFTGHSPFNIFPMVETPTFDLDVSFGLKVARRTSPYRTGEAVLLPFGPSFVIVADKTGGLVDCEVQALDDLCVAGSASEFHSPSQFP